MIITELLRKWFHLDEPPCAACEVLKMELALVREEKNLLLNKLINPSIQSISSNDEVLEPIRPKHIPWNVLRQQLEQEDRIKAEEIKQSNKLQEELKKNLSINELEKELGIEEITDATK